jgi:hypothetical protein
VVEGVTFRSESEGMRWDRGDAVAGRVAVPPVNIWKNESQPRPSSEGRASGRDGSGTLRVSPLLRGTTEGGARALSRPFPAPAAAATTVAVREGPVDPTWGVDAARDAPCPSG